MNSARTLGGRLRKEVASVFVCDVQERFRDVIHGMPCVIDTTSRMVRTANALNMPVITTEQYPKGLGKTVEELQAIIDPKYVFEKTKFSMWTKEVEEAYNKQFDLYGSGASGLGQVLLCGIETHVCIFQTALDLLERGVEVHVVVDGVSSQRPGDRSVAVQRLAQAGAWLCTSEMAMFQLVGDAKAPGFKEVSAIAKEKRPEQFPSFLGGVVSPALQSSPL